MKSPKPLVGAQEDSFSLGEQKLRAGLDLGIGEELTEPAGAAPVVDDQNLVAPSSVAGAGVDVVTEVAEGASAAMPSAEPAVLLWSSRASATVGASTLPRSVNK